MSDHAHKPSDRPGDLEVPELDFAFPKSSGPPVSGTAHAGAQKASAAPAPVAPPPPPAAPQSSSPYGGGVEYDGDEMEIDRNGAAIQLTAESGRPRHSGFAGGRIELGDNVVSDGTLSTRSHVKVPERRNWAGGILSTVLVAAFAGGAGYALFRFVHRARGWNVAPIAQKALGGGSATWSGAASMAFLALSITFAIMAMYARPRSLGYGVSALASVIIGVTLMIITFSVGPDGAPDVPPDGAIFVPWLFAVIPLGVAFRLLRNAWDRSFEGEAKNHLVGILLAALAAATAFVSVELLFGAGISRFF